MSKCECKECLHYDACKKISDVHGLAFGSSPFCDHYKSKSLFVELPARVGDTVYYLTSIDTEKELGVKEIFCGTVQAISYDGKTIWVYVKYTNGLFYYHNSKDFGKTVFIDREKAKRKLREVGR